MSDLNISRSTLFSFFAGGAFCFSIISIYSLFGAQKKLVKTRGKKDGAIVDDEVHVEIGTEHPAMEKYGGCIYLDYNATTPIFPEVSRVMEPFTLSCFGNPSSHHVFSGPCRDAIRIARHHIQKLVNANKASEVVFTSCGTESDNRAIDIAISAHNDAVSRSSSLFKAPLPHIVTCAIEHPAVLLYLKHLEAKGRIELSIIPVDEEGTIYAEDISKSLRKNTALVTIMHSNNEVGTIQPIQEIASIIKAFNTKSRDGSNIVLFHSDAAQSLGKVTVDVSVLGVDMLTIVGHKFGAPKGIAALYVRSETCSESVSKAPLLIGGGQESTRRGGTENVLLIAGLGEAARLAKIDAIDNLFHLLKLKRRLILALRKGLEDLGEDFVKFNGPQRSNDAEEIASDIALLEMILRPHGKDANLGVTADERVNGSHVEDWMKENEACKYEDGEDENHAVLGVSPGTFSAMSSTLVEQLPNTLSVSFKGIATSLLMPSLLDKVACSAGSACHSDAASGDVVSPVLVAMKVPDCYSKGTLRLSFGRHSSIAEIDRAARHIIDGVRQQSSAKK